MASFGQEIAVVKEESKWAREYDLRWSKMCFLIGMIAGAFSLWNIWRYVPEFDDKLGYMFLVLVPASLGAEVWKAEKRGEMKKPMAQTFLMFLGLLTVFSSGAIGKIVHAERVARQIVK